MSTVVEREPARFSPVRQPSCPIGMLAPRLMVLPAAEDTRKPGALHGQGTNLVACRP